MKIRVAVCLAVIAGLSGCAKVAESAPGKTESPAKVSGPVVKESELASVRLTPEAEIRLGIETAPITTGTGTEVRRFIGEVTLPPGRSVTVTAPVAGTLKVSPAPPVPGTLLRKDQALFEITPLLPLPRDLRVTAEADVEQARTRVETAKLRKARADKMLKDEVGTVRAQEDALNELDLATSALQAAEARLDQIKRAPLEGDVTISVRSPREGMLRQLFAAPGQVVNGGAPLFELADLRGLWLRIPVYAGESGMLAGLGTVNVEMLSGKPLGAARAVSAPPTADPLASTVDYYFEAPPTAASLKPGERLVVAVPARKSRSWSMVPWGAVVFDIHGGAWVYEKAAERLYVRRRIMLDHTTGGIAFLASGPKPGTPVVIQGVAELWGVEFGAGK